MNPPTPTPPRIADHDILEAVAEVTWTDSQSRLMGGRGINQGLMPGQRTTVAELGIDRAQRLLESGAVRIVSPDEPPPTPPPAAVRRDDPAPAPLPPMDIPPDALLMVQPGHAFSYWNQLREQVKLRAGDTIRATDVGNAAAVAQAVANGTLAVVGKR